MCPSVRVPLLDDGIAHGARGTFWYAVRPFVHLRHVAFRRRLSRGLRHDPTVSRESFASRPGVSEATTREAAAPGRSDRGSGRRRDRPQVGLPVPLAAHHLHRPGGCPNGAAPGRAASLDALQHQDAFGVVIRRTRAGHRSR